MEHNWILKEAMKSRKSSDVAILEKPDVKSYLNSLQKKRFWPVIHSCLEVSGYDYSQITFYAGHGDGWGYGEEYVDEEIKKVIDVNIRMHDFAIESIITPIDLGEFLTIAYEAYEAY